MAKTKNIKVLDDFIKAYNKQKEAGQYLEYAKQNVIEHFKCNSETKTEYKDKLFVLCEKKTFSYSHLSIEMAEATAKQKKIEELTGEAKLKSTSDYIRLSDKPNKKEVACK